MSICLTMRLFDTTSKKKKKKKQKTGINRYYVLK